MRTWSVIAALLIATSAVKVETSTHAEATSRVYEKAYRESGRELLQLFAQVNGPEAINQKPLLEDIMAMIDIDGNGHVTFDEMNNTLAAIAKLFGYTI